jgi:hypothetical protein
MRAKIVLLVSDAALTLVLSGCGGGHGAYMPPAPPSMPSTTELDTAALLSLIETKTSDTAQPFAVDNGAVALTPAGDESSPPLSVDAT